MQQQPGGSAEALTGKVDACLGACAALDGDAGEPLQAVLAQLRELRDTRVSKALLQQTQAGKKVKRLAKHAQQEVAESARAVVAAWVACVQGEQGSQSEPSSLPLSPASTPAGGSDPDQSTMSNGVPPSQAAALAAGAAGAAGPASAAQAVALAAATIAVTEGPAAPVLGAAGGDGAAEGGAGEGPGPGASAAAASPAVGGKRKAEAALIQEGRRELREAGALVAEAAVKLEAPARPGEVQRQEQQLKRQRVEPPPHSGDPNRDKVRAMLAEALGLAVGEVEGGHALVGPVAAEVESAVHRQANGDERRYKTKLRSLHFNLKDAKNPDLRRRVLARDIPGAILVELPPEELASDARRGANTKIRLAAMKEAERGQQQAASTDQFQCGRCRQWKTTYYQLQTRSADEPMTNFVTCVVCGNRWKFC